jgi:glycosyltransferase involved in cell wall biosynthesis
MKILLTLFEIQDYGGIVGDIEFLMKGLREHGHSADLVMLRPSRQPPYTRKPEGPRGSYKSVTGGEVNTLAGWYGIPVFGYVGLDNLAHWQKLSGKYDLVIHEIPNPKMDEDGWWRHVYDIDPPQLIAAHDAHFRDLYPYIREIAHKIKGISCTNHAGYVALEWCPIPRAFIGAAHELQDWSKIPPWGLKAKQAVCAHVWKAWKNMDKVVRAIPLVNHPVVMAGDGIEGRYMRSKDKCKEKYKGIWEAAKARQPNFWRGLLTHGELFNLYQDSRVMVDMSFSRKFHALGNHFNRSVIESYNNGVLPICTSENMYENSPQVPLFSDGKTHVAIGADSEPAYIAEVIDWAISLNEESVRPIIERGRAILAEHFDYRKVCLEYLKLAKGEPAGIYPKLEVGQWPAKI